MKHLVVFMFLAFALSSCSSLQGAFTYYKVESPPVINRIGFCSLGNSGVLSTKYSTTNEHFSNSIIETSKVFGIPEVVDLKPLELTLQIDSFAVVELCKQYNIEAILVSRLKFILVTETMLAIPINQRTDVVVE